MAQLSRTSVDRPSSDWTEQAAPGRNDTTSSSDGIHGLSACPGRSADGALAELNRSQLIEELLGLREAMKRRAVIEQAKGIVMATCGCGPQEAFRILVAQSQHENRKLRVVAGELVERQDRRRSLPLNS